MKNIYAIIIITFFCLNVTAQTFEKGFTQGSGGCAPFGLSATLDNKLMFCGYNNFSSSPNVNWLVLKTDTNGSLLSTWEYDLGGSSFGERDCRIYAALDSGFFICGRGGSAASVLKVTKTGTPVWSKSIGPIANDVVQGLIPQNNGSVIVANPNGTGFGLLKFNSVGTMLWCKSTGNGYSMDAIKTLDNKYLCTGMNNGKLAFAKFDTSGTMLWSTSFNSSGVTIGMKVCQTSDSGFVAINYDGGTYYLTKIDKQGTLVWVAYPPSMNYIYGITAVPGNKVLIVGNNPVSTFSQLVEVSPNGTTFTQFKPGNSVSNNNSGEIIKLNGKYYLNYLGNPGPVYFNLVKLNANYTGCSITSLGIANSSTGTYPLGTPPVFSNTTPAITTPSVTFTTPTTTIVNYCALNPLSVSTTQNNPLCNGQCTGLATAVPSGGTSPYTYLWAPGGQTTATKTGMCAGSYTVTVTDANSVTTSAVVTINQPIVLSATTSTTFTSCGTCCDGTASVNATGGTPGYTYLWSPGGQTTASISAQCNGTYTVCVTDANNCTACSTVNVSFNVGIDQNKIENDISIYPNPFSEKINVEINNLNGTAVAEIFNVLGEKIFTSNLTSSLSYLDLSRIESGIYFMKITTSEKNLTKKIIKE